VKLLLVGLDLEEFDLEEKEVDGIYVFALPVKVDNGLVSGKGVVRCPQNRVLLLVIQNFESVVADGMAKIFETLERIDEPCVFVKIGVGIA
jgi:hypothetical protein